MTEDSAPRAEDRVVVPQARNPAAEPDSSPGKQSELKLNIGIGILGTILSIGVVLIFLLILDELVFAIVFAVIALISLALTLRFAARKRRARSS